MPPASPNTLPKLDFLGFLVQQITSAYHLHHSVETSPAFTTLATNHSESPSGLQDVFNIASSLFWSMTFSHSDGENHNMHHFCVILSTTFSNIFVFIFI